MTTHREPTSRGTVHEDGVGGYVEILESGGPDSPMVYRMRMPPGVGPPAPEHHPSQREDFRVLTGTLDLGRVEGRHLLLAAGETFSLPAGVGHKPAAAGDEPVEFEAALDPGLDAAEMFVGLYAAMRAHHGFRQVLALAVVFTRHKEVIRFPGPMQLTLSTMALVGRRLS